MTWKHVGDAPKSWHELRDQLFAVAQSDQLACRGQCKDFGSGKLFSSIDRAFDESGVAGRAAVAVERLAIQRFRQQAPNYLPVAELMHIEDGPSLLMLMRHYGAPTRLLDWTESLWVAVFNAANGGWTKNDDADGHIWVFERDQFDACVGKKFGDETPLAKESAGELGLPAVTHYELKEWVCRLMQFGPKIPRLIAQQGMFTIGSRLGIDHAAFIDSVMPDTDPPCKQRLVIPGHLKRQVLKELAKMGITASAMFPGVDGVGMYLDSFAHFAHLDTAVLGCANGGWGQLAPKPVK